MALPAGRYGVTKNQLLKIKKLPMNTIKLIEEITEKFDLLGTAAFKNSTSVVTQSTDLVESGAVKDIVGWGNKNLGLHINKTLSGNENDGFQIVDGGSSLIAKVEHNIQYVISRKNGVGARFRIILFEYEPSSTPSTDALSVVFDNTLDTYSFNSGIYNYVVFTYDNAVDIPQDTAEAMIEVGSTATAYEPHHSSVNDTLRDAEVIEGKNALNNEAVSGYSNGVTFEVDSDKIVTLKTGTPSSTVFINVGQIPSKGSWILNGVTSGSSSTYGLTVRTSDLQNPSFGAVDNYDGDTLFTIPENYNNPLFVYIRIPTTGTVNNNVIKPMIRRTTESDPTYEPYYVPLKDVVPQKCDNSVIGTVEGANASKAWSAGEHFIKDGQFKEVTQPITSGGAISDSNTVNKPIADCLIKQATFSGTTNSDGNVGLDNTGRKIIAAFSDSAYQIVTLYKSSATSTGAHITNTGASPSAITDTAVSGTYYYI